MPFWAGTTEGSSKQLQQTLENDPFKDITLSDVEYAAPMITLLEDSDTYTEVECLGETPYFNMIGNVCLIDDRWTLTARFSFRQNISQ